MLEQLKYDVIKLLFTIEIATAEDVDAVEEQRRANMPQNYN